MWEGDTNLLLSAGVGGTFMKAFGTAFTGAGLVSCHTHTRGHQSVAAPCCAARRRLERGRV